MQKIFFGLVIFVSGVALAQAQKAPVSLEAIIRETQVSNALSDRYKALRLALFLKEKRVDTFVKAGAEQDLEALERLNSTSQFEAECKSLARTKNALARDRILYACGRLLVDDYSLKKAKDLLNQVGSKSPAAIPARILLGTIHLGDGDGATCLKTLPPTFAKAIKAPLVKDTYHMTRARCMVEINKLADAILEYQLIAANSPLYYDALEETAWVQFKMRNLDS